MPLHLNPTFRTTLVEADRPLMGMWVSSGTPLVAEICAGSGLDWLLFDMEHGPNELGSILVQLQAVAAYPITPVVRVPGHDAVIIKQVLDLGAQNLIVPMVSSVAQARAAVAAVRYPPGGRRGIGSALARSGRWNRVENYLADGDDHVSLFLQIEDTAGAQAAVEIAELEGVDGIFVGPSDLAASMGLLGQQTHGDVQALIRQVFAKVHAAGKPVGVNAFDPVIAAGYIQAGADFMLVGADVAVLARGSEALAQRFITDRASLVE